MCNIPVQGSKIVGRLAADPNGMMAGSTSPTRPTLAIPSYPTIGHLDPISPPPPMSEHHHLDTVGEEQLAAGSSLNTHKVSDHPLPHEVEGKEESSSQSDSRTDRSGGGREGVGSGKSEGARHREQQGSLVPPIEGAESQDRLSVPEVGDGGGSSGGMVSSGASSATESWEDLEEKVNGVVHSGSNVSLNNAELDVNAQGIPDQVNEDLEMELGSVRVTEWNLAHSLKLRDTDVRPDVGINKTEMSEESESDSDEQGVEKRLKGDGQSDSSSSKPNSPPCQGISIPGQSTLYPTSSLSERGGRVSGGEGMEWWKEAMAETQNVTDDIDSLVEQLEVETDGTKRVGGGGDSGTGLRQLGPFSLQSQSSSAIHDKHTEKKISTVSSRSTDGMISVDMAASNDGERRVGRERDKELRRVAGYSSTDSVNSSGRRSKTGGSLYVYITTHVSILAQYKDLHVHVSIIIMCVAHTFVCLRT